jgi:hypothetical protein
VGAALALTQGACETLGPRSDLHMRLETDWLAISEWQSPADLSNRLKGRPFAISIAEHNAEAPRRKVLATAEVWLTGQGDVLAFRLGDCSPAKPDADRELRAGGCTRRAHGRERQSRAMEKGARFPPGDPVRVRRRAETFLERIGRLIGRAVIDDVGFTPLPPRKEERFPWEREAKSTTGVVLEWTIRATTPSADLLMRLDAVSGNVMGDRSHASR